MRLPIGYDIFAEIIEKKLDYVDKTLFIQEILDEISTKVIVITRPRRFGKTLNLSMLQHFFAAEAYGRKTNELFNHLKIAGLGDSYMKHQGKYPVIFISFKDINDDSFSHAIAMLGHLLAEVFSEHRYLLDSPKLGTADKEFFSTILGRKADQSALEAALRRLSDYLFQHHGARPWLLIDEYDTPIQAAFVKGYYQEMISLMRGIFSSALKTNPYLEKAVITGILRIAKESLFSGLNNIKVYTVLNSQYGEYFGFTEAEITDLLQLANLTEQAPQIRHWYNGYLMGNTVIYNPWSIVNCLNDQGLLRPYWVNTSGNDLIRRQLALGDSRVKENLRCLLSQEPLQASIDEEMVFGDLDNNDNALWSLLLFNGYLKAIQTELKEDGSTQVQLIPPNYEVLLLYRNIIRGWFSNKLGEANYQSFLQSLIHGEIEKFIYKLPDCLENTLSLFDVTGRNPEKFYHGFVLGLMVSLQNTHEVQSNKESGLGFYDVCLIPKDRNQLGVIMEFKTVKDSTQRLTDAAQLALQQIKDRDYAATLRSKGITKILHLGLAFYHKQVEVGFEFC